MTDRNASGHNPIPGRPDRVVTTQVPHQYDSDLPPASPSHLEYYIDVWLFLRLDGIAFSLFELVAILSVLLLIFSFIDGELSPLRFVYFGITAVFLPVSVISLIWILMGYGPVGAERFPPIYVYRIIRRRHRPHRWYLPGYSPELESEREFVDPNDDLKYD